MKKVVSLLLIITVLIVGVGCSSKSDRLSYKYGNTGIEILNKYKDNKITAEDAAKQIKELSEIAKKESDKIKDKDRREGSRLSGIGILMDGAYIDLYFGNSMSILKINECIEEIEDKINDEYKI